MDEVTTRVKAKPCLRSRLVPIVKVIEAVACISDGKASVSEVCEAITTCEAYKIMIYQGNDNGLAEPLDGKSLDEGAGFNERIQFLSGLFNSRYWERQDAKIDARDDLLGVGDFFVAKSDKERLAECLWDEILGVHSHTPELFPSAAFGKWSGFAPSEGATCETSVSAAHDTRTTPPNDPSIVAGRWPWGSHHTASLGHLEAAAKLFWVNYDPSDATTAPTNVIVSEWLQSERRVSQTMADSIASMLRQDGLPTGPRK